MDQNNRYDRQIRLPYIDHAGQEKLGHAHVAIVGQGALGTAASSYLARAGVGHILIIDNDIVELSNLQRQTLFDESDVGRSKADAACEHLGKINSDISIASSRERLTEDNAPALLGGADIVIDASDNFEARKIINNCCVPRGIPWIYGGVVQSQGMTMNIVPGRTVLCMSDARRSTGVRHISDSQHAWYTQHRRTVYRCRSGDRSDKDNNARLCKQLRAQNASVC